MEDDLAIITIAFPVSSTTLSSWQPEPLNHEKIRTAWKLLLSKGFFSSFFLKIWFIYVLREGKEEGERNSNVWLPFTRSLLRAWPATQACALTENWTRDPLTHRPTLNPLSHNSQGSAFSIWKGLGWMLLVWGGGLWTRMWDTSLPSRNL